MLMGHGTKMYNNCPVIISLAFIISNIIWDLLLGEPVLAECNFF